MTASRITASRRISIHALRVEGDVRRVYWIPVCPRNFYPRPPGGGRRQIAIPGAFNIINFYPRPPGGGRPADSVQKIDEKPVISIHALRVEGDMSGIGYNVVHKLVFLSTPSGWRATMQQMQAVGKSKIISIHALRVEGDFFA